MNTYIMLETAEHFHSLLKDSDYTVLSIDFKPHHAVLTFSTKVKVCYGYEDGWFYIVKNGDLEYVELEDYLSTVL